MESIWVNFGGSSESKSKNAGEHYGGGRLKGKIHEWYTWCKGIQQGCDNVFKTKRDGNFQNY